MREIKFRAWDKLNKKMFYVDKDFYINNSGIFEVFTDFTQGGMYKEKFDYAELMQYTGRKDKKGNEIYEDDIFEISGYLHVVKFGQAVLGSGKAINGWYLEYKGVPAASLSDTYTKQGEVVGNMYENTELSKGGEK